MITFGLRMQDRFDKKIPKEVYDWVLKRNKNYPNINFTINPQVTPEEGHDYEQYKKIITEYSLLYTLNNNFHVSDVCFPYLKESWFIKIIGIFDKDGNILDPNDPDYTDKADRPLGRLRNTIAGTENRKDIERIPIEEAKLVGRQRMANEPILEKPTEMIELKPNMVMLSDFSATGKELKEMINNPIIRNEVLEAFEKKDWKNLKKYKVESDKDL
jgi:hypothetical protein